MESERVREQEWEKEGETGRVTGAVISECVLARGRVKSRPLGATRQSVQLAKSQQTEGPSSPLRGPDSGQPKRAPGPPPGAAPIKTAPPITSRTRIRWRRGDKAPKERASHTQVRPPCRGN